MKLNLFFFFTTLLFLSLSYILAQERIYFDCVPLDIETKTGERQLIPNKWIVHDKIVFVANTGLHLKRSEMYIVEDEKLHSIFNSNTTISDNIYVVNSGFFFVEGINLRFVDNQTWQVSEVLDKLYEYANGEIKIEFIVNKRGVLYLPSDDSNDSEKVRRLHYSQGTPESTFFYKEFKTSNHADIVECDNNYFTAGIDMNTGKNNLWKLSFFNRKAEKVDNYEIKSSLITDEQEKIFFFTEGTTSAGFTIHNFVYYNKVKDSNYVLLSDSFSKTIKFRPEFIGFYANNFVFQADDGIWGVDLSTDSVRLINRLESILNISYSKNHNFFAFKTLNGNYVGISDGTAVGTHKINIDGNWELSNSFSNENNKYIVIRRKENPFFIDLYEVEQDSILNLIQRIDNLSSDFHFINNQVIYASGKVANYSGGSSNFKLWSYTDGKNTELLSGFNRKSQGFVFEAMHNNKLFISENYEDYRNIICTDGTQTGTKYVAQKLLYTNPLPYKNELYYLNADSVLGQAFYKNNAQFNELDLEIVPFPFSRGTESIPEELIQNGSIYDTTKVKKEYRNQEYGHVLYRDSGIVFFRKLTQLWYSEGSPSESVLIISGVYPQSVKKHKGKYWFTADGHLYSTDKTMEGTKLEYVYEGYDLVYILANTNGFFMNIKEVAPGGFKENLFFYDTEKGEISELENVPALTQYHIIDNVFVTFENSRFEPIHKKLYYTDGISDVSITNFEGFSCIYFPEIKKMFMQDSETNSLFNVDEKYQPKDLLVENYQDVNSFYTVLFDDKMIFYTSNENLDETNSIWITDGTASNTKKILNTTKKAYGKSYVHLEDKNELYFVIYQPGTLEGEDYELYKYDIEENTTFQARYNTLQSDKFENLKAYNGKVCFEGRNDFFGNEFYCLSDEPIDPLCINKYLTGIVFNDINGNGKRDAIENGISNVSVLLNDKNLYNIRTNEYGRFYASVGNGAFHVRLQLEDNCFQISSNNKRYWVDSLTQYSKNLNFGLTAPNNNANNTNNVTVNLTSSPTRCGFLVPFWATATNYSCDAISGELILNLDKKIEFLPTENTNFTGSYSSANHSLTFKLDSLPVFQQSKFKIILKMPDENFVGENIFIRSYLNDKEDLLETFTSEIKCAVDPNDKLVSPNREDPENKNYTLLDEQLQYTIRFQNTGNDTAFNVKIIDTLSNKLNYKSLDLVTASHNYKQSIDNEGVLTFQFDNILLPDSTTNEPLSHGFVTFNISPNNNISPKDVILNRAGIYFDFNEPIITNTAKSTFVESLNGLVHAHNYNLSNFKLFPNPARGIINLILDLKTHSQTTRVEIKNIMGQIKQSVNVKPNQAEIQMDIRHLNAGLYFCIISLNNGRQISLKTIKM